MAKLSVIMPVYNAERYLRDSIESVLNQSLADYEFLICDDGSSDNSAKIIEEYSKKDERIVPIKNEQNIGYLKTLNKLIKLSRSHLIARMDADDISYKNRFKIQYDFIEKNNCDLLFSHANLIDNSSNKICKIYTPKKEEILKNIYKINNFIHPTLVIKKEVFEKYGLYCEDYVEEEWELWKRIYKKTNICIIEDALLGYRLNLKSHTSTKSGRTNRGYGFEAAKACLGNFDQTYFYKFYNRLNFKGKFIIFLVKNLKYYELRYLLSNYF